MNRQIKPWYITLIAAMIISVLFIIITLPGAFVYGQVLPALALGFCVSPALTLAGICIETRSKQLLWTPILNSVPLTAAILICIMQPGHLSYSFFPSSEEMMYTGFAFTALPVSAVIMVITAVRAVMIRKRHYEDFLKLPRHCFHKRVYLILLVTFSVLYLIVILSGFAVAALRELDILKDWL